jgi:hypothetical protein
MGKALAPASDVVAEDAEDEDDDDGAIADAVETESAV